MSVIGQPLGDAMLCKQIRMFGWRKRRVLVLQHSQGEEPLPLHCTDLHSTKGGGGRRRGGGEGGGGGRREEEGGDYM